MFSIGDCIFIKTDSSINLALGLHLFIVLFDTKNPSDRTILVPLCSIKPGRYFDSTIILNPGDHPFIKVPTYVDYYDSQVRTDSQLSEMILLGIAKLHKPSFIQSLCKLIRDGIGKSEDVQFFVQSIYHDFLLKN